MKVLLSPQRSDKEINYHFEGEKITVTMNDMSDTFDFTDIPDGVMEEIETILSINPIISAKRESGILYVELLNFIGQDATEEEKFPEWQEV